MIIISVIIPTHNRKEILEKTLNSFNNQIGDIKRFEIIIIDDGSNDNTSSHFKNHFQSKYSLRIFSQNNKGPAAARNLGIKKAKGKIVLIINDDTIPSPQMINKHLIFHQNHPEIYKVLLGLVTWHKELKITPFMNWLENGGPYFNYYRIKRKIVCWQKFWTCNISLKKEYLLNNGLFDESFPTAAWEDYELGYRLHKAKMKLYYEPKALGYHHHKTTIESIKYKMLCNGRSAQILKNKIPDKYLPPIAKHPRVAIFINRIIFNPISTFFLEKTCQYYENKFESAKLFDLLLLHYRLDGLQLSR
jgi:glycosyltransferase involved in cell wall biosynthesis